MSGGGNSSFYTSRRTVPIDDWVADTATNGRARRLGRRTAHVTFHEFSAMDGCSPASMVSHTHITYSHYKSSALYMLLMIEVLDQRIV